MVKADENGGGGGDGEQYRKLFIGGLTYNTTDDMLRDYYSQWGEIVDCIVMRDPTTKRSRGFGFVTYAISTQLDDSMNARPHVIDGKTIEAKRAIPRDMSARPEANMSVKKLYVSGVREEHTEQMFKDYFIQFGTILEVEIITDKQTGKPRGFAFVTFDDYDAVDKCVLQKSHMIDSKRCDVKKALSKEEIKKSQQKEREKAERDTRSKGTGRAGGGGQWGGSDGFSGGGGGGYSSGGWNQHGGGAGWNQQGGGGWGGQGGWNQAGYGGGGGNYGSYGQAGYSDPSSQGWNQPQQQGWGQQGSWSQQPVTAGPPAAAMGGWGQQPQSGWNQQAAPQGWQNQGTGTWGATPQQSGGWSAPTGGGGRGGGTAGGPPKRY